MYKFNLNIYSNECESDLKRRFIFHVLAWERLRFPLPANQSKADGPNGRRLIDFGKQTLTTLLREINYSNERIVNSTID